MPESRNWRPLKWSEETIHRRTARAYRIARRELALLVGPHLANILYAEILANLKVEESLAELRRRKVKLIGDL